MTEPASSAAEATHPALALVLVLAGELAGSTAVANAGQPLRDVLLQTGATVGAFATVTAALWWLTGPRIREWVRKTAGADGSAQHPAVDAAEQASVAASTSVAVAGVLDELVAAVADVQTELAGLTRLVAAGAVHLDLEEDHPLSCCTESPRASTCTA